MNIVQIEDIFHPEAGYQLNVLSKYFVKQGHTVTIITAEMSLISNNFTGFFDTNDIKSKDALYEKQTGVKIIRIPIKKIISGRAIFAKSLEKTVENLNPDILYVHGNDTVVAMNYINNCKKLTYPLVSDSHMLEMASVNKFNKMFRLFYKAFITPKIIKLKIPIIRTQDDNYVERCLGIPLSQCPWISYGSDMLLFNPNEKVKSEFRKANNILPDDFVVVYTGKLDKAKDGKLLAETFLKKFKTDKNVVLVVVGTTIDEYGKEVDTLFEKSENKVIRFPTQKYTDLPKFYQMADLCVFAKQCSLSFYDAEACGLSVLSEDNNINVDRCSHNNGWTFKSGDSDDFRKKIEYIVNMDAKEYKLISNNAYKYILEDYNYEDKAKEYETILLNEYKRFNREGVEK